jgi:ADP-heptose:LPS heptosyltransferase
MKIPAPVEITWLGRQPSLDVIANAWPTVRCIEIKKSLTLPDIDHIVKQIGPLHLIVDLQGNLRSRWVCHRLNRETKAPIYSAGKIQLVRNQLLMAARLRGRRRPLPTESLKPKCMQYQMMVNALREGLLQHLPVALRDYVHTANPAPQLPVGTRTPVTPWQRELLFGRWLAVAPGAAHATKQAPAEIFSGALDLLKEHYIDTEMPGIVILGDEKDRKAGISILDQVGWRGPVLNLAGRLTLWETTMVLNECHGLLSNDSALGHIAEAVETPVAVLFGPTVEAFGFPPRMRESKAFSTSLGCRPCSKHGRTPCRYNDHLCFAAISLPDVANHLASLIARERTKNISPLDPTQFMVQPIDNGLRNG